MEFSTLYEDSTFIEMLSLNLTSAVGLSTYLPKAVR